MNSYRHTCNYLIFRRTLSNVSNYTIQKPFRQNQFIYEINVINMRSNMAINLVFSPLRSNFIKPQHFRLICLFFFSFVFRLYENILCVYVILYSNQNVNKKAVISTKKKSAPALFAILLGYKGNFKVPRKIATHIIIASDVV